MPSTGLTGPYALTVATIDGTLSPNRIGAYACGHTTGDSFYVDYVGRSDDNVAGRLKQHVGKYREFKYGYFNSAKAAFEKECSLYHDFTPSDNTIHPARPANSSFRCPVCGA